MGAPAQGIKGKGQAKVSEGMRGLQPERPWRFQMRRRVDATEEDIECTVGCRCRGFEE
ncbi:hypothetical protein TRIP_B50088 [uncultured Desulfatiglans sp.]|nr:hypothetical protein TRIP_B50088 [uncultured Desulfatiglans sp.]